LSTKEEIRKAIRDSKVLCLSLSGGWGQTRRWIKQWEKDNGKKIDKATDWHDSGYICPYCAEKVAEFDIPHPISAASALACP
jgi:hypothetical protein